MQGSAHASSSALLPPSVILPAFASCCLRRHCFRLAATTPSRRQEEHAKAAWSEVLNQYQRRADLIPNLVETVKGYAAHEKDTLEGVVEARAKATQVTVTPETLTDPNAFKAFQDNQAGLTSALSRLLAVVENYPDLKANQNFLALQAQLEGTENRIAVARRDYIEAVRTTTYAQDLPVDAVGVALVPQPAVPELHRRRRQARSAEGRFRHQAGRVSSAAPDLTGEVAEMTLSASVCARPAGGSFKHWPRHRQRYAFCFCCLPLPRRLRRRASRPHRPRRRQRRHHRCRRPRRRSSQKLADFEKKSSDQIVVATVPSLDGEEIEPYANRLFRAWKLGQAGENNGVLLLVAPNDRKMRIEVGYGLEGTLTDLHTKLIIENTWCRPSVPAIFPAASPRPSTTSSWCWKAIRRNWRRAAGATSRRRSNSDDEIIFVIFIAIWATLVLRRLRHGHPAAIFGQKIGPARYRWLGMTFDYSKRAGSSSGGGWTSGGWSRGRRRRMVVGRWRLLGRRRFVRRRRRLGGMVDDMAKQPSIAWQITSASPPPSAPPRPRPRARSTASSPGAATAISSLRLRRDLVHPDRRPRRCLRARNTGGSTSACRIFSSSSCSPSPRLAPSCGGGPPLRIRLVPRRLLYRAAHANALQAVPTPATSI